jgi:hypothetical protein
MGGGMVYFWLHYYGGTYVRIEGLVEGLGVRDEETSTRGHGIRGPQDDGGNDVDTVIIGLHLFSFCVAL